MKAFYKVLSTLIIGVFMTTSTYAAYDVVSCDSSATFAANSCDQCFSGGAVSEGDNKGLLTDVWENNSDSAQLLFKEEQDTPRIVSLGGTSWSEVTASDSVDFWNYTTQLDALYDEDNLGYSLPAGESVTWLESSLGSAYQLVSSSAPQGDEVGMIIYDISVHAVDADGLPDTATDTHRECVMYTSGESIPETPVPETPRLPETGPEHIILALAALLLGFGFLKFRKK